MAVFHPRTRLDSFVEGGLSQASRDRVSAHLAECADCRREVGQRQRILRAASSLRPVRPVVPPPSGSGSWASSDGVAADSRGHRPVPVLERREGVAGWKVVLGCGAAGLLASGVLMTAWIAGDPEAGGPGAGQSEALSFAGASIPGPGPDGDRSTPSAPAPASGTTAPGTPGPAATPAASPSGTAVRDADSIPADLAPAGSILSSAAGATPEVDRRPGADTARATAEPEAAPVPAVLLAPARMTELRQAGWNVPTFHGLGMVRESTGWQSRAGVAEVVVTLADDGHTLQFHECRTLQDEGPAPTCPVGSVDRGGPEGPAAEQSSTPEARRAGSLAIGDADVVPLPVGVDMYLREHADGSWTATLATAHAGYAVDSDLPVESAPRVMSMVVISERSRVQGGTAPESPGDRFARGFERLLPWAGVTESQRR